MRMNTRFRLRTLLIAVSISSLFFGWFGIYARQAILQKRAVASWDQTIAEVTYDFENTGFYTGFAKCPEPAPKWIRTWLDRDLCSRVVGVEMVFDPWNMPGDEELWALKDLPDLRVLLLQCKEIPPGWYKVLSRMRHLDRLGIESEATTIKEGDLAPLRDLPYLRCLELGKTRLSSKALAPLRGMRSLKHLWINETALKDGDLIYIREFPNLELLSLSGNQITNAGLTHLAGANKLDILFLEHTEINDVGLQSLSHMSTLRRIDLAGSHVTQEGIDKLQKCLPECKMHLK